MNEYELKSLLRWLKNIGVMNFGQLEKLKEKYRIVNNCDLLNFTNILSINMLKMKELI